MAPPRSALLLVPALAGVAVLASGPPLGNAGSERARQAKLTDFPAFLYSPVGTGALRGSIAAVQRTKAARADAFTSLHGLKPSTDYDLYLTKAPCSRSAGESDAMLDLLGGVTTGPAEDDFFVRRTASLRRKLARGRAFRLFEGDRQAVCVSANRVR
jgi:hypothetical protein